VLRIPPRGSYDLAVAAFVSGLDLARAYYDDVVAPQLGDTRHSAGLLGWGSDVLGFDTARSTDHGWGPRLQVFVDDADVPRVEERVAAGLPDEFRGWPTRFGWDAVPVTHHVYAGSLGGWLDDRLGFDPLAGISTRDWLASPQQRLLEVTGGAVFHDGLGELEAVRRALAWYPDDVWLWLLACQWRRLDQEEAFVGRTAEVGDELGSRVLTARLVRDLMRLCFLLERRYAPYAKWLGTAFARLDAHRDVGPLLHDALGAADYPAREAALTAAARAVAQRQNALGVTRPVEDAIRLFHERPYRVLGSSRFAEACVERVTDPWLRSLPLVGGIDQLVDSTDALERPSMFRRALALYSPDA
jgi:hypothetical protein